MFTFEISFFNFFSKEKYPAHQFIHLFMNLEHNFSVFSIIIALTNHERDNFAFLTILQHNELQFESVVTHLFKENKIYSTVTFSSFQCDSIVASTNNI